MNSSGFTHCALTFALLAVAGLPARAAAATVVGPQNEPVETKAYSRVLYIDPRSGSDSDGDGSAARPWSTLTHALEEAGRPDAAHRTALLVSQGTYEEPTLSFKANVDIYGGFANPGGVRDIQRYRTVLDGGERHRIALGADDMRADGLVFTRGRVRGKGAALLCDGTSPVVSNCVFLENRTLIPPEWRPRQLHETANDGGAVMITNGATPRLEQDFFYHNTTECGRGAALAVDRHSSPKIARSVFANNRAGLDDPMRSSDGGAIAVFDHSAAEISDNVVVANAALDSNDAGGIWIALWSPARVVRNIIVANNGADDAGGLFVGGQEHRYGVPLDTYPAAEVFTVVVADNVLVGNVNGSRNSGATRITMESRVRLTGNLITENAGGLYLQRSEVVADGNTVWQDWKFLEDKPTLGPSLLTNNVLKGPAGPVEARASFEHNLVPADLARGSNEAVSDIFKQDGVDGRISGTRFDPVACATTVVIDADLPGGTDYAGRPVRVGRGASDGQWRVIKHASGREIVLWGAIEPTTHAPAVFSILRTFTPKPDAPAGFGARSSTAR